LNGEAVSFAEDDAAPLAAAPEVPRRGARSAYAHNRTLDGIRGCFALAVVAWHTRAEVWATDTHGAFAHFLAIVTWTGAQIAVLGFFVLSGLVLTRAWKGSYPRFLLRRFVRLWPLYALTLAAGYALAHRPPLWSEFFWWPILSAHHPLHINDPAWSLCVEAWAMLFMPLFVWAGRGRLIRALAVAAGFLLAARLADSNFVFAFFFITGAFLSRFELRLPVMEAAIFQFFGRISYPLYLSHWLVLHYTPAPILVRVVVCFVVAWLLTITVERWSIVGSRAV